MTTLVTIVLDSGAFLQNIDDDPSELDIGYFESRKQPNGNDVPDIHVYADAEEVQVQPSKLGKGRINVVRTNGSNPVPGLKISDSLKQNLLRKRDLYGQNPPAYNKNGLECILHFDTGHFRCSKVKNRRFVEVMINGYGATGVEQHIRPIAHDVIVHYNLADDDELKIEREGGPVLFTTEGLKRPRPAHIEIELVCNNATAELFFCDALDLTGRTKCWLPNQGDPTSTGSP